jgi:hypothetical protein
MTKRSDQETIVEALQASRRVLGEYIAPGPRNPMVTVERLLELLDTRDIEESLRRLDQRNTFSLVSIVPAE